MKRGNVITLSVIVAAVVAGQLLTEGPAVTVEVPPYDPQAHGGPMLTAQQLSDMSAPAAEAETDPAAIAASTLPDAAADSGRDPPSTAQISASQLVAPRYSADPQPEPLTFNGYECTSDCSGHRAGYRWAERNWITDPMDCMNHSRSFEQGCQSWVEEQAYAAGCTDEEIDDGTCEF